MLYEENHKTVIKRSKEVLINGEMFIHWKMHYYRED